MESLTTLLATNPYPGRGIVVGLTPDRLSAVIAYFVMGRSVNSRNRVLTTREDGAIITKAYDERLLQDPSLVIYSALRTFGKHLTVVTNGDQTDTILQFLKRGQSFEAALRTRAYEPDGPNFTPRISALVDEERGLSYRLSILRERRGTTVRNFFEYAGIPGEGHFLHTYVGDGNPLPPFEGEPVAVGIMNDPDDWMQMLWSSLNTENRVALLTRFIRLSDGTAETRIINQLDN